MTLPLNFAAAVSKDAMSVLTVFRDRLLVTIILSSIAIQVLNISIDPKDVSMGPEDLTINEIESYVELLLEVVFENEDAIEETEESDETPIRFELSIILFSINSNPYIFCFAPPMADREEAESALSISFFATFSPTIQSPPPEFVPPRL